MRQTGGLPHCVGEQVHWVGGHEEDAVEAVLHDVTNDGVHDVDVLVHELQAGLARLLCSTSTDDDHGGVSAVFVGALGDTGAGWRPDDAVVEVHYVTGELLLVDIDDGQVIDGSLVNECECVGNSNVACADEYNFVSNMISHGPIVPSISDLCPLCARSHTVGSPISHTNCPIGHTLRALSELVEWSACVISPANSPAPQPYIPCQLRLSVWKCSAILHLEYA